MRHAAAGRTLGRQCVERERHGRRCMASAVKPGRAGDVQRPPRLCTAPWTVPVGCDHSYKIEASQDASILSVQTSAPDFVPHMERTFNSDSGLSHHKSVDANYRS